MMQLGEMQRYVAKVGITASAVRNLGAAGFMQAATDFLIGLDMKPLATLDPSAYPNWLDVQTQALMAKFPIKALWGPARKCINIFMVMASLNVFLRGGYSLDRLEFVPEVPLDNSVERKLRKFGRQQKLYARKEFPKWNGIKSLECRETWNPPRAARCRTLLRREHFPVTGGLEGFIASRSL